MVSYLEARNICLSTQHDRALSQGQNVSVLESDSCNTIGGGG